MRNRQAWEWGVAPGPSSAPEVWAGVQRGGQCDWEMGSCGQRKDLEGDECQQVSWVVLGKNRLNRGRET